MMRVPRPLGLALGLGLLACGPTPPPAPQEDLCQRSCEQLECLDPSPFEDFSQDCQTYCMDKVEVAEAQGETCKQAFTEGLECVTELSCQDYNDWVSEGPEEPCPGARQRVAENCDELYLEPHILPPP